MRFYFKNRFVYQNIALMLNELYNTSRFNNYAVVFEYDELDAIKELKSKGFTVVFYDLDHIKNLNSVTADNTPFAIYYHNTLCKAVDEIWTYTLENKQFLIDNGYTSAKFRPITYTNSLKSKNIVNDISKPIDVLFYGNLTNYRYTKFVKTIQDIGCTFVIAHAVAEQKLDWLLSSSKIVLDTLSGENCYNQNTVRMMYPVINNCCVLSQHSNDDNYMGNSIEYFTDETDLKTKILNLLYNNNWKNVADNAAIRYKTLCESGDKWHTSDV